MTSNILKSVSLFLLIIYPFVFAWGQWEFKNLAIQRFLNLDRETKISILEQEFSISDSLEIDFDITVLSKVSKTVFLKKIEIHASLLVFDTLSKYTNIMIVPMMIYNVNKLKVAVDYETYTNYSATELEFRKTKIIETDPRLAFHRNEPVRYQLDYELESNKIYKRDIKKGNFYFVMHLSNDKVLISKFFERDFEKKE